jgi:hypothetical protein
MRCEACHRGISSLPGARIGDQSEHRGEVSIGWTRGRPEQKLGKDGVRKPQEPRERPLVLGRETVVMVLEKALEQQVELLHAAPAAPSQELTHGPPIHD